MNEMRSFCLLVVGVIAGLSVAAPPASAQAQAQGTQAAGGSTYRVGPRDLLHVSVFEVPEVNGEYRVDETGVIRLPLVERIQVGGLTEAEAEAVISRNLVERFVNSASVDIELREFRSSPITMMGAVRKPGPLNFSGRWTLFDAIMEAGGVAEGAGNSIFVLRRAENGLTDQISVSTHDLLVALDPRANIPLQSNDIINVPAVVSVTVYALGQIATTGAIAFTSNERVTVLAAIARAGGLTDRASKRISIKRRAQDGRQEEIKVNYKRILSGEEPDVELQEGDIILVPEAFF